MPRDMRSCQKISSLFVISVAVYLLDHVLIDANGLITWEIVGSYVIDVNGLV
jgi:hypothetical protein